MPMLDQRPASVGAPFGFGTPAGLPLDRRAATAGSSCAPGASPASSKSVASTVDDAGDEIPYDALVLAVGARALPAVPGATTFAGPRDAPLVAEALDGSPLARTAPGVRRCRPPRAGRCPSTSWPRWPRWSCAIGAARARLTVVTAEPAPLWVFGPEAGAAIEGLLADRGSGCRRASRPSRRWTASWSLAGGEPVAADEVIALPRLEGPAVPGLPSDDDGFIPIDAHGRVAGADDVFATGDARASRSSRAGWPPSRPTRWPRRSPPSSARAARRARSAPSCAGCCSPAAPRSTCAPSSRPRGSPHPAAQRPARRAETLRRGLRHARCGGRPGRWPAATSRRCSPRRGRTWPEDTLADRSLRGRRETPDEGERERARAGAVDGQRGRGRRRLHRALQALEAASAMAGGILPGEYAARREQWRARAA